VAPPAIGPATLSAIILNPHLDPTGYLPLIKDGYASQIYCRATH
jgi:hypothetical protein